MMKKLIILLFIFLIFNPSYAFCQSNTYENSLTSKFINFDYIYTNDKYNEYDKAIEYAVEIIKSNPQSYETSCVINKLYYIIKFDSRNCLRKTVLKYKIKYFDTIDDYNSEVVEKIMLAYLMSFGMPLKDSDICDQDEMLESAALGMNNLIKMKDNIVDKNYSQIALALLTTPSQYDYCYEYLERYPNSNYCSIIESNFADLQYYRYGYYHEYIKDILRIINKYKLIEIITPYGYNAAIDKYYDISLAYILLKDYKNAKKYLELIKKETQNYSELKLLEAKVKALESQQ